MAKATKLPSGKWRVQVFVGTEYKNGKKIKRKQSFTADTKKEAEYIAAQWNLSRQSRPDSITVATALERYITQKSPYLSPATVRGYERMRKNYFNSISGINVRKMDVDTLQTWINALASEKSAKTVHNAYGLLKSAMELYGALSFRVTLPQVQTPALHTPTDAEVTALMKHVSGELLTAVMLAAFCSLRRGEICALEAADVHDGYVHVNKDMVADKDGKWHVKKPKTDSSVRKVMAPPFVLEKLPKEGRICPITPKQLTDRFRRAIQSSHIQPFRFHDLRHYYVSIAHAIGVPDAYIMKTGGWKNPTVMNRVYKNVLEDVREKEENKLSEHFEEIMGKSSHESSHDET